MPNNDAGSNIVKEQILRNRDNNTLIFTNLKREVYFSLLNHCKLLIGNSSSGIIESPSFNKYSINIGNRQNERFQSNMTLNCDYGFEDIQKTIQKGLKSRRRKKILNPYGDGNSSEKIIKILEKIKIGKKLIEKKLTI